MRPASILLAPLAVIAALAAPSVAPAATVTFSTERVEGYKGSSSTYGTTRFAADAGETNTLRVTLEDGHAVLRDTTAPVRAGSGCEQVDGHAARCALPAFGLSLSTVAVEALDGDDLVDASAIPDLDDYRRPRLDGADMQGGSGADTLIGTASGDDLEGGDGDDVVEGRDGDDDLVGGAGQDRLMGGEGRLDVLMGDGAGAAPAADLLDGGPGGATVSYADRSTPVSVDLADPGDDGAPGEGDVLRNVDDVIGGTGADSLVGDEFVNRFFACLNSISSGCQGDVLAGRGGDDQLMGATGDDRIDGGAGADTLADGQGNDRLSGGEGDDHFDEYLGEDVIDGGPGEDTIDMYGDPAPDVVSCGEGGRDRIEDVASADAVALDCERYALRGIEVELERVSGPRNPALRFVFDGRHPGSCVGRVRLLSTAVRRPARTLAGRRFRVHPRERFSTLLRPREGRTRRLRLRVDFERCRGEGRGRGYGFRIRGGL